ncbi:NAD(P)(+) transhydrogenase (Re/Si-specific) subunit beta [Chitinophaga oryzae]|uniref:NAD(P) transhydrogenase subunit beta n=1 Tax=Chitinophaga oryzae TaxID=2725414 RepID=A0AAE6ZJD4_9BACT|nr:NAD(P)(+) transhydrogenase (Re/Si-specific) subunit beta [Chitinophaga oryzae]QJB33262.1 NAD(P)(+) transhydrogenase (Re/Si-specific) subunit beta [Chitinophaga oryzae]QJB39782.1 NAD(P)(+) transhydrogenase (Re/Si-specific) subunit beta [Chitinophaga oryzae]
MGLSVLSVIYLIGSVTFILGLKMLSKPDTARKGNLVAAAGMALAILGTIFLYKSDGKHLHNYGWIAAGLLIGSVIGVMAARKVKMTAMPEMVSMFNGMGGACAALISVVEFDHLVHSRFNPGEVFSGMAEQAVLQLHRLLQSKIEGGDLSVDLSPDLRGHLLIILLGLIIGAVSFAGSVVAWGKLNGRIRDFAFKGQHIVNLVVMAIVVIGAAVLVLTVNQRVEEAMKAGTADALLGFQLLFYLILVCALIYGVLFVLPIGGADMPVVISLLNSFTGVAAACGGFLYDNPVMLTGGILVGSAGTILTILMCRAMNRSLKNVLIGSFGGGAAAAAAGGKEQGSYKEISLSDAAVVMAYASKVMIVPGYGLAVAQAQHACHELEKLLEDKGVEVKYAIHPVAGRMPGHMNVLLAEADVPYEKLLEMEDANAEMPTTDAVLVLGANDVVNPAAKSDPASPIYGMPILEVENAKLVIVNKRSMKPGYAGIENELFFQPKTSMLFGDAKQVLQQLVAEIKQV